jgi:hypothetical protein
LEELGLVVSSDRRSVLVRDEIDKRLLPAHSSCSAGP